MLLILKNNKWGLKLFNKDFALVKGLNQQVDEFLLQTLVLRNEIGRNYPRVEAANGILGEVLISVGHTEILF